MRKRTLLATFDIILFSILGFSSLHAQAQKELSVIAYYAGDSKAIDTFDASKLTQIIFSFGKLKGNQLYIRTAEDSLTIQKLVALKQRHPSLTVLLSLGGWGGCETCSDIFTEKRDRKAFARSTKEIIDYFGADGIDLDWEYPAIEGFPGHKYKPEDRDNFTKLVKELRKKLGKNKEVTFAAGVSKSFFENSVDWVKVMPMVDRVNLMTYDLAGGTVSGVGHHTPLYSTSMQPSSAAYAINFLDSLKIPRSKMVIGAGFYARVFEMADTTNKGLYQKGTFKTAVAFKEFEKTFSEAEGFTKHWDPIAQAPYYYNAQKKLFVTMDDLQSIHLKTKYAKEKGLDGIMFWQLTHDKKEGGLVDMIYQTKKAL
jgi:chitinase